MWRRDSRAGSVAVLIGRGTRVHGDIEFEGGLHLDGRVNGCVRADGAAGSLLSVSESGHIVGDVEVANLILNGTIQGDIRASERVVLGPRAKVEGDVRYRVIETAPGAQILGRLVPAAPPEEPQRSSAGDAVDAEPERVAAGGASEAGPEGRPEGCDAPL